MMLDVLPTTISGLQLVSTTPIQDHRGTFSRLFCHRELDELFEGRQIQQINQSLTHNIGSLRGLHFQRTPHAEMKLIRCLKGKVWDVALDLRAGSPTFLQWFGQVLSPENALMMVIPEGCAHGFQVLEPDSELLYLHTAAYAPESEDGIRYDDPLLDIKWPLPISEVSERDKSHPPISEWFQGVEL